MWKDFSLLNKSGQLPSSSIYFKNVEWLVLPLIDKKNWSFLWSSSDDKCFVVSDIFLISLSAAASSSLLFIVCLIYDKISISWSSLLRSFKSSSEPDILALSRVIMTSGISLISPELFEQELSSLSLL